MTDFDQLIEDLTAEYRAQQAKATELHRKLKEITGTATAPRGAVKVSVGAQGDVRDIEFPTGAYKRMAPTELTAALLETIEQAKTKALDAVRELMQPEMSAASRLIDAFTGNTEAITPLPEEPAMPDVVRDYLEGRTGDGNG